MNLMTGIRSSPIIDNYGTFQYFLFNINRYLQPCVFIYVHDKIKTASRPIISMYVSSSQQQFCVIFRLITSCLIVKIRIHKGIQTCGVFFYLFFIL